MDNVQLNVSDYDEGAESSLVSDSCVRNSARACEPCRTRKTRCDRAVPCLQCQRTRTECTYLANRPREKRTRILLTPQYEKKIDQIDHRLEAMTQLLRDLKTQSSRVSNNRGSRCDPSGTTCVLSTNAPSPSYSDSATTPIVEGQSSLSAHSVFVNEFVQNFVTTDLLGQPDPETRRTLDALSTIANDSNPSNILSEPVAARVKLPSQAQRRDLPPIQKAVSLIRIAKVQRLAGSGWVYEYITMKSFGDLCLEVYFADQFSPFDFISVNAGLYSLFWDFACVADISENEKEQHLSYARLCRDNLEAGLANLPLHIPAAPNVVAALLFAAFYAIGSSKSLLCWSLSSKASELCQTLGYHRTVCINGKNPEDHRYTQFLFWSTYYVDKSLSLRLGRASTIPEWDIGIDLPSPPSVGQESVLAYFVLWIKLARCQGNIYEYLYSPGSINQPDSVRQSRIELLRSTLHDLEHETQTTMNKWLKVSKENAGENLMDFYATSDAVLRLSLLTHVYRAAPRAPHCLTTFSSDCVQVARATIAKHHECMEIIQKGNNLYFSTYIHWTLLFAPFVPIIVVFCNVMETRDHADLARLEAFLKSIESASAVSEPAAKMHKLFQVLYNIAVRYIEVRAEETEAQLAALGLPHARTYSANQSFVQSLGSHEEVQPDLIHDPRNSEINTDELQWAVNPMFWMGNGAELENWFYDNQSSMETLQDMDVSSTMRE
ncbi:hypothetical protein BU24DRAFT_427102 [Aaosphaeria arxii CBS 175.79]|uniref:Zn(2)-C6 fungal-type domain-containing protein n=1 Tax=Aaosphaeria arxii CBS 175.79 TaxID=1450172 RepID=A0A6A5XD34_9PLEO|nr:uncharacterized protein BU24DRAFT_427102 [Aaosphaeria arxii CBS 175.79]KAF2010912.1 hypothetical protein BU24DRAFT_427102 [Aaosphaeria arxii CBS 175.79]